MTPFEVVFCGPNIPNFELPRNFKFIYSTVKPAQCLEIALRQFLGEYVIHINDDFLFSEKALDILYDRTKKSFEKKIFCMASLKNIKLL